LYIKKIHTVLSGVSTYLAKKYKIEGKIIKVRETSGTKEKLPEYSMKIFLTYSNVPKDSNGWVRSTTFFPFPYDLCSLLLEDGKSVPGWWTGQEWEGRRLKEGDIIVAWKKSEEP
jgi:hypothetical protein